LKENHDFDIINTEICEPMGALAAITPELLKHNTNKEPR